MNVQQSNKKSNQKFTSENITTYKICTATSDKQQLLTRAEYKTFILILNEKNKPDEVTD